jgi:hypothetical protein
MLNGLGLRCKLAPHRDDGGAIAPCDSVGAREQVDRERDSGRQKHYRNEEDDEARAAPCQAPRRASRSDRLGDPAIPHAQVSFSFLFVIFTIKINNL